MPGRPSVLPSIVRPAAAGSHPLPSHPVYHLHHHNHPQNTKQPRHRPPAPRVLRRACHHLLRSEAHTPALLGIHDTAASDVRRPALRRAAQALLHNDFLTFLGRQQGSRAGSTQRQPSAPNASARARRSFERLLVYSGVLYFRQQRLRSRALETRAAAVRCDSSSKPPQP
ncbi:uncharacterized protein K452DRAFT_4376 [Aplosporella prunicola CBS 121167]|uniref:Uncharacterized protein n=1 Tax=Aplosporella prunicola CBS 121167 TaxID=1176127 RepID=A0A6A6BTF5_9PEZI|nr:uncharacterized protein K452DRAFT_4376 [Aplosporella prunicola CBS 121167]KAF2147270.1 hypothetical protein K452DRAFT_4376 [Aplosporella prunicola CBS 121167]